MPCTTILVGKDASYDGSTMIARNDDGFFDVKKLIVVQPKDQLRKYKSKIGHLEIQLPDDPLRYTSTPSVDPAHGVWAANGINAANVAMTATEIAVLVVGIVTAFVVSVISIKFLMGYIKKNDFTAFGVYRIIVGIVVLAYFGVKVLL